MELASVFTAGGGERRGEFVFGVRGVGKRKGKFQLVPLQ